MGDDAFLMLLTQRKDDYMIECVRSQRRCCSAAGILMGCMCST
jgi:hypothetical protein